MWQTYTPDGSVLALRLQDGLWIATCLGARADAATAEEAIRGALRVEKPSGDDRLEQWISGSARPGERQVEELVLVWGADRDTDRVRFAEPGERPDDHALAEESLE